MQAPLSLADLEANDSQAPQRGAERRFLCPLCGPDKPRDAAHRSLALNVNSGAWTCHRCGARGLLRDFWTERPITPRRARTARALAQAFALPSVMVAPVTLAEPETEAAPARWREWWDGALPLGGAHGAEYLEGRGVSVNLAHESGVRFSPQWYGRPAVLFPIRDAAGEVVAVSGRFIDGRENPKTMCGGPKSMGVFVTPGALEGEPVAVTEASIDSLALAASGIPSIALIGTSGPAWLAGRLAFRRVILATDADEAGDTAALKLRGELESHGAVALRLRLRGVKDWGEYLERYGAERLRRQMTPFSPQTSDTDRAAAVRWLITFQLADEARFAAKMLACSERRLELLQYIEAGVTTRKR